MNQELLAADWVKALDRADTPHGNVAEIIRSLVAENAAFRAQVEELARENARLSDLLWGARCVYCGEVVGRDRQNQEVADDVLRQHVRTCQKHPLVQAEAKLARVVDAVWAIHYDIPNGNEPRQCAQCGYAWPCATYVALAAARKSE